MPKKTKKTKSKKSTRVNIYLRQAERQDIVYLVNWLQSDDYQQNYLSDYVVYDNKILKDMLLKEITLARFIAPKKEILVAEANGEYLVGVIFLAHIDWRNRNLALQVYFPEEYRKTDLPRINIAQVYEYVFGRLNMNKVYTYVAGDTRGPATIHLTKDTKTEAVLPDYIFDGQGYQDLYVYSTFKKEVLNK